MDKCFVVENGAHIYMITACHKISWACLIKMGYQA